MSLTVFVTQHVRLVFNLDKHVMMTVMRTRNQMFAFQIVSVQLLALNVKLMNVNKDLRIEEIRIMMRLLEAVLVMERIQITKIVN